MTDDILDDDDLLPILDDPLESLATELGIPIFDDLLGSLATELGIPHVSWTGERSCRLDEERRAAAELRSFWKADRERRRYGEWSKRMPFVWLPSCRARALLAEESGLPGWSDTEVAAPDQGHPPGLELAPGLELEPE